MRNTSVTKCCFVIFYRFSIDFRTSFRLLLGSEAQSKALWKIYKKNYKSINCCRTLPYTLPLLSAQTV